MSRFKIITLSNGLKALVDEEDYGSLSLHRWFPQKGRYTTYVKRHRKKNEPPGPEAILMHRCVMKPTKSEKIDHKNGNGLDNRKENLRVCTNAQNMRNARARTVRTSKFRGVSLCSRNLTKRWRAQIKVPGGKNKLIGRFLTEKEAAVAYNKEAKKLFGEFYCSQDQEETTRHRVRRVR